MAFGKCYVSARLNLLGINFFRPLGLWDIPISALACNSINTNTEHNLAAQVKTRFPQLFTGRLGKCTKMQISLTLKQGAKPVFRKARPVLFAAAPVIAAELERLQHLGVISPVNFSQSAAPIVAVKKRNGKIRICGNYSTSLNDILEPNQYPLPTPESIFATLAGKKLFSKIDLSNAFLQCELDDDAKKLLTINTLWSFHRQSFATGSENSSGQFPTTNGRHALWTERRLRLHGNGISPHSRLWSQAQY